MIDCETRSRILFEMLATGSGLGIRIGGKYRMSVHVIARIEGWTCHVSNGGVPCEAATCMLRGGPYNAPLLTRLFCSGRKDELK